MLHGYPIEDARVVLYDGSYHDVDSSAEAFRIAASLALRAIARARPMLLEPVMRVSVAVPEEYSAQAEALLSSRGAVAVLREGGEWLTVSALLPIADTFGLAAAVRARTDGRGLCSIRFSRYAAVQGRRPRPSGGSDITPGPTDAAARVARIGAGTAAGYRMI